MDVRGNFFSKSTVRHCQRLPREMVESPSLEVFQNSGDVALRDVSVGTVGDGLGLDWLILEVFSNLNGSTTMTYFRR